MVVIAAGEEGLSGKHLCKYAAYGPHIDCAGIFFESEHDFRSAVPAGGDVFCMDG